MGSTRTLLPPFMSAFITLIFMFSTIYTLAFLYYQGASQAYDVGGLEQAQDPTSLSFLGLIDAVLDVLAWISPFALVRGLLLFVMAGTPDLFNIIDLLLLRPVSWIVAVITAVWIKSWIPTESGEL